MDRESRPFPPEPLLDAKLIPAPTRLSLVPRARLTARLEEGSTRRLTLVSAPAGFGKTTLVLEWLRQTQRIFAWLALDADDNDPAHLLTYLIAALQRINAHWGKSLPNMAQAIPPPPRLVLSTLLHDIASSATPLFLVLDDYHVITAAAIHDAVAFLLDYMPPSMHLVLLTRADPPLALARLRARDQMVEIRADVLRFTDQEAALFLNGTMRLDLSGKDVAALTARTEGWIAGLQLAALSLQGHPDAPGFINSFTGSHRYVFDYLVQEALEQRPQGTRNFLLQTSVLDRLSGPLCDAVTGQENGQATLERLEQANLFLVALDHERQWYRYHRLFEEMLRHRLLQEQPALVPRLHLRAARWYEQHGMLADAVEHALRGQHWELAAQLIGKASGPILMRGRSVVLRRWLERLPEAVLSARPELCFLYAWSLYMGGELDRCEGHLRQAEQVWRTEQNTERVGEVLVLQANIAVRRANVARTLDLAPEALALLPQENFLYRSLCTLALGRAYQFMGQVPVAMQTLSEARALSQFAGNVTAVLLATTFLGDLHILAANLHEAERAYREAMRIAEESRHWQISGALMGLGHLQYEWNDLDAAQITLERGLELGTQADRLVEHSYLPAGYRTWARLLWALGRVEEAFAALDAAQALVALDQRSDLAAYIAAERVRLWLWEGNLSAALAWETAQTDLSGVQPVYRDAIELVQARLLLHRQATGAALDLLMRLQLMAEAAGRTGVVIESLTLQALAHQAQGDLTAAVATLARALTQAEPEGYVRTFVDLGEPLRGLLSHALARGVTPAYCRRLLAALPTSAQAGSLTQLPEPLTKRECEVMRLVVAGFSNPEIADTLVISYATVKRHINAIFGKLGVQSRAEAIRKALDLHLV